MNTFLLKIAEMVYNKDTSLPYRRRVEVAIFKDGKVLLTKNKNEETGETWYGFPGGGTEGKSDEETAHAECLEEVGIAIQNVKSTTILQKQEGINDKKGRGEKYRGTQTKVFTADFLAKDDSKLGDDGDDVKFVWKTPNEAAELLKKNSVDSGYRIKAMRQRDLKYLKTRT